MKKVFFTICVAGLALFGVLLTNCADSSPGAPSPYGYMPDHSDMTINATYQYSVAGDSITVMVPDTIMNSSYCSGSQLVTTNDTVHGAPSTIHFTLSMNTLTLYGTEQGFTDSSAIVRLSDIFARAGSGYGLVGQWNFQSIDFTLVRGSLTEAERAQLDSMQNQALANEGEITFTFNSSGQMTESLVMYTNWADKFIAAWDSASVGLADSALYDITVVKINEGNIWMRGDSAGEVVTISYDGTQGTTTYTSSDTAHMPYIYYDSNPASCPNNPTPDWWSAFLAAYPKSSLAKTRQVQILGIIERPKIDLTNLFPMIQRNK